MLLQQEFTSFGVHLPPKPSKMDALMKLQRFVGVIIGFYFFVGNFNVMKAAKDKNVDHQIKLHVRHSIIS